MFEKFQFSERQIKNYHRSAARDFKIARDSDIPEVVFKFCYDVLIKTAIAVSAKNGLRVKARQGHHIELLRKLSECLKNPDIEAIGNEMRSKRNLDLYGGGTLITEKETGEYKAWITQVFVQAEKYLYGREKLL